jgi:ATP-binding cassette subfamily B protein
LIQSAIAGAERVFEILDMDTEFQEQRPSSPAGHAIKGEVAFRDVSFGYKAGTPVLKRVSFTAKPGDTIALVGPTGVGKTTIVNLLTRFYDIEEGAITIDGVDIRDMEKTGLRRQLGMVLQDAYVFSGTIRDNIRYGRLDASNEEVEAAAKLANADGFIAKLPHGYDTILSAEGSNVSHGQRQLLTIARTILADPAILILDEATSSIDTRTEMHIQEAMRTLMKGRTSFVIAHRLSTIQDADMIVVLSGGEIVEKGTHHQLLEAQGFYYELYTSQFQRAI